VAVELKDKLGIPSAVWLSAKKVWLDPYGRIINTCGPEDVARCPFRVAIVSTGLIIHESEEAGICWGVKYGTVVSTRPTRPGGGAAWVKREGNQTTYWNSC